MELFSSQAADTRENRLTEAHEKPANLNCPSELLLPGRQDASGSGVEGISRIRPDSHPQLLERLSDAPPSVTGDFELDTMDDSVDADGDNAGGKRSVEMEAHSKPSSSQSSRQRNEMSKERNLECKEREAAAPKATDVTDNNESQDERSVDLKRDRNTKEIRIVTLNIRGLRDPHKVEALKQMLHDLDVGIGVITETHLSDREVDRLVIPGYKIKNRDCRPDAAQGGVIILVRTGIACIKLPKVRRPALPISACTILLYPTGEETHQIRITGVYFPPSTSQPTTQSWVSPLTDEDNQSYLPDGSVVNHLIVGDVNQNSWQGGNDHCYHEWMQEVGAWELSDPIRPTHEKGSALDKFILLPGGDIPDAFLQPHSDHLEGEIGGWGETFYPAVSFPDKCIADHHPLLLAIPCSSEDPPPKCAP